jgi:hypothetical protein
MLGYDAIRYIPGFPASYVKNYAEVYAAACVAEAVAQERERCAKVCDELPRYRWMDGSDQMGNPMNVRIYTTLNDCADAIRAGSAGGES